ncbi:MAG: hypothetical protein QHH06_07995 [Clostridiales bacterium]|jgi:hypothetical protein|nr:hypothetical protein [Eubacteriales bacterium]MDH7566407.1 hypothetical protein [Clostridiales bacterium]
MDETVDTLNMEENTERASKVVYNPDKDFYKGMGGEWRYKAEGLFKKAKEKGISIEEITITPLKEAEAEFPGLGIMRLPAYIVKVKGRHIQSGQTITDGKQIDYYNMFQSYLAEKIEKKNFLRDEKGKIIMENNKPKLKKEIEFTLSDWELFEIGKSLVTDKEFGLEKTITGACDRIIRKLMGENDWLYPDEARQLDEEFNDVQERIIKESESRLQDPLYMRKKATDRQISYFKAKIKNSGLDPEDHAVIGEFIRQAGFDTADVKDLSTGEMSRIIDSFGSLAPKVREALKGHGYPEVPGKSDAKDVERQVKQ